MYVAKPLGQNSLIGTPTYWNTDLISSFTIENLEENHGNWRFAIRACVDRRDDADVGRLDCDPKMNFLMLNVVICSASDGTLEECEEEPVIEPVDDKKEEEPVVVPDDKEVVVENSAPKFVEFDSFKFYQIEQGTNMTIWLPEYVDADDDDVEMTTQMTEN